MAYNLKITTNTGNVDVWSEIFENSNKGTKYYALEYDKEKYVTYRG